MDSHHSEISNTCSAHPPTAGVFTCSHCDGNFPAEDQLLIASQPVCDNCSDEFALCIDCNAWVLFTELDDEQSCLACRKSAEPILAYRYRPEAVFYGEDSNFYLGLELELNIEDCCLNPADLASEVLAMLPYAYAKKDRSIPHGFELVTHPATLKYHSFSWMGIVSAWNDVEIKYRLCCADITGMHVHLSRAFFSPMQLAKLVYFINHDNNMDFLTYVAQRPLRHWARRDKTPNQTGGIRKALTGQLDRFRVLNCNPADTVELRLFNGSSKIDEIMKNLQFAHSLAHWIKQADNRQCADYRYFINWLYQQQSAPAEFKQLIGFLEHGSKKWLGNQ